MALREIIARFGIKVDARPLAKADKSIAGAVTRLQQMGGLLVGGVVARGLKNFVVGIVEAGDKIGKTATQLGLSTGALQSWSFAADLAGVDSNAFSQSLRLLQKNSFEAARGSKAQAEAFDALGVSVEGADGQLKSADVLIKDVGLALNGLENSTERVALAQTLMGRSGARLLPLFKDGQEGIDAAAKAFDEFGGGLQKDIIPLAEAAQDRFTEFSLAVLSLKSRIGIALLPILSRTVGALSKFIAMIAKAVDGTELMTAALIVLGVIAAKLAIALIAPFLPAIGTMLAFAAKLVIVVLLVEDLLVLFKGGKSAIGAFLDKLFGKGKSAEWVAQIKADTEKVLSEFGIFWDDMAKTAERKGTSPIGEALEELFSSTGAGAVEWIVGIAEQVGRGFDAVVADILGVPAQIAAGAAAFAAEGAALASAFVEGMINGIAAGIAKAVAAAGALAKAVKDQVDKVLDMGSPSRVAFKQGANYVKGFLLGEKRTTAAANFAAGSPGSAAASPGGGGARGSVSTGDVTVNFNGGAMSSSPETQRVIREVVQSAVQEERRATVAALEGAPA